MRDRRLLVVVLAGLMAFGLGGLAVAQDLAALLGRPVTAVRFEVEGVPDNSPTLATLSDLRVGQPLRQEDIRLTMGHLDALGRYDDIVPVATVVPDGVEVVFRLVPRHPIARLELAGDTGLAPGTLRGLLVQRFGGVPATVRIATIEDTTRQFLEDEGYLQASVKGRTELTHEPHAETLFLDVIAGPQARVAGTEVRGTSVFTPDEVMNRTHTKPGEFYKRREIEAALTVLEDTLRDRGFYEAQASMRPTPMADGVHIVISVEIGARVELRVTPEGALPAGRIADLIPVRRLGAADQDLLEDAQARIERALRADGYWKAQAPFARDMQQDGRLLVITFTIVRGPRYVIERIDVPQTTEATVGSERALDELLGVRAGDVFDQSRFVAGLNRVTAEYRRKGYYQALAKPSYEEVPDEGSADRRRVILHPNIMEGPRGVVAAVTFTFGGAHKIDEAALRDLMQQKVGRPFVEAELTQDRAALRTHYRDLGFRQAFVDIVPTFSGDGSQVSLAVSATEGVQVLIGQISVVGNQRVSEHQILEEMQLAPGQPAGEAALQMARSRLQDMGGFSRVTITAADQFNGDPEAHLIVSVVESKVTTLAWGAGLEGGRYTRAAVGGGNEDYLNFSPRGSFEIGRRNLGGRKRDLNLYSRVALKPRQDPDDPTRDGRGFGFTEYRVTAAYREREAFRSKADLTVATTFEQAVRTDFNFLRKGVNAEILRPLREHVSFSGRYALDFTRVFDERIADDDPKKPLIDRLFPQVRLSYFSSGVSWDRRDSPLAPTKGLLASADLEVAARTIGSEVGYAKIFLQNSAYRSVDQSKKTVLAGRAEIGIAVGFPRTVARLDDAGNPVLDPDGQPIYDTVQDLPANKRFYAGGSTTVRGFQLDRLGVPKILTADGLSLGGNGVVILNGEIRRTIARLKNRDFGLVGFVDIGNVFAKPRDIDLGSLRAATGFGIRYDSPLGPVRVDFGLKTRRDIVGGERERAWEYHLSIGEAF